MIELDHLISIYGISDYGYFGLNDCLPVQQIHCNYVIQFKTVTKFAQMLEMNDFEGDLDFDDEKKTLDLCVSKKGKGKSQTKDMKALR